MKKWVTCFAACGFVGILLFTGCSGGSDLDGTAWLLVALNGQPPVTGTTITLAFSEGQASGHAGCNSYGAGYSARRGRIRFESVFSTLMACLDQGVMDQEQQYLEALGGADSYTLAENRLTLTGGIVTLVFIRQQ